MITAVILAAGASSRMGTVKALLPLEGETLLARILRLARAGGAERLLVALGPPHGARLAATLPPGPGIEVAWNEDPSRGMLSSVQAALRVLAAAPGRGALLWPVDVPLVTAATVQQLLAGDLSQLTAPCYAGRGGHPLWLPAALYPAVLALPTSASLRTLRQSHPLRRIPVEDPGVLRDLDTPADFERALAELPQR